jgi:hypothetical protein
MIARMLVLTNLFSFLEQFAIMEASYVLIRFLQEFATIESRDSRPWQENIALTTSSLNGVRVSLKRSG